MASLGAIIAAVGPQLAAKAAAALREKGDTETAEMVEALTPGLVQGFVDGEKAAERVKSHAARARQIASMAASFLTARSDLEIPEDEDTRAEIASRAVNLAAAVVEASEVVADDWIDEEEPST